MANTTIRALKLLSLLQARRTWTGQELMSRLGVSERTLRRDIDRLRELGYEVGGISGPAGGYQLAAGADLPPLVLDDEEAVAIAMGLITAAGGTIKGIEETSVRALAKLETVLPPRIRRRVQLLQSAVVPMIQAWVTVDSEILTVVATACRDRERLRFSYRSGESVASERHVEPHQLVTITSRWYLLAFDLERDDWRTFRLDRIEKPFITRFGFEARPVPGGNAAEYVQRSLRTRPMRHQVVATLEASAEDIAPRLREGEGEVEALGPGRCLLRTQGDHLEWLAFMIIWLDVGFEVHEPPELIDYLVNLSSRLKASLLGVFSRRE